MSADVACRVALDHQVEVARMNIAADRRVRSDDFFVLHFAGLGVFDIEVGGEGDVLADWKAENTV